MDKNGIYSIGKIDIKKYNVVTDDIKTDEVIITDMQINHIKDRHGDDFKRFFKFIPETLENPDYILEDEYNKNTALILKEILCENEKLQLILRLHTSNDNPEFKNSIISFWKISNSRWESYLRNKKIIYTVDKKE